MTDYIERAAAMKFMDDVEPFISFDRHGAVFSSVKDGDMLDYLRSIPAADVRPVVRGKWIDDKGNHVPWDELNKNCPNHSAYCSVCGEWLTASDEYPATGNFCPNCGAKMGEDRQ